MAECRICPRLCGVDREKATGFCGAGDEIKIGRAALHFWEEPSISGDCGSGTVFFSGCNLRCVYCQNRKISRDGKGKVVSKEELSEIFLKLEADGAHNINLVSPTHYATSVAESLRMAKRSGLKIPVVYNCGGYESAETLREICDVIDIYMPDFKYFDDKYAIKYSGAKNYAEISKTALAEMFSILGKNEFDSRGIMQRGIIVRHMMLPGLIFDSKKIIDYLYKIYGDDIYISIMSQYTPMPWVSDYPEINRKVSDEYYGTLVGYAAEIGVKNAYIQDGDAADESFIPEFYGE